MYALLVYTTLYEHGESTLEGLEGGTYLSAIHSWMLTLVKNWPGTAPLFSNRDYGVLSPAHMPSILPDTFW